MPSNLVMCIQQLLDFAGLNFHGPMMRWQIGISPTETSTDITLTVSCVRSWAMGQTTEDSRSPLENKPNSQPKSLQSFNRNISVPFHRTDDGMVRLMPGCAETDFLLALLAENGGSLEGVTILLLSEKLLLTIPNPPLRI